MWHFRRVAFPLPAEVLLIVIQLTLLENTEF